MADPISISMAVGAASTLVGGAVKTMGSMQAASAKQAMYTSEADVASKIATAESGAAAATGAAGFRAAQGAGLRAGASIAGQTVGETAGNINPFSGSSAQIRSSQIALAGSEQRETFEKYRAEQYQQDLTAAEKTAEAGRYQMAAAQAGTERQFDLYGGIASTLGDTASMAGKAFSVSPKWFGGSTTSGTILEN